MRNLILFLLLSVHFLGNAQSGIQLMNQKIKLMNKKKDTVETKEIITESKFIVIPQKVQSNQNKLDSNSKKIIIDSMSVEFWPFVREYVSDYSNWLNRKIKSTEKLFTKSNSFLTQNNAEKILEDKIKISKTILDDLKEIQKVYDEKFKIFEITLVNFLNKDSVALTSNLILKEQENIEKKVDSLFSKIVTNQKAITEIENKVLKTLKVQENKELTAKDNEKRSEGVAPAFTSFFGNNLKVVPQVSIFGSSILSSENKDFITGGEIKFFTAGNSAQSKVQFIDLLYSDLSSYCIQMNFQSIFAPAAQQKERRTLGVGLTTNFLGKTVNYENLNTQNILDSASTFSNMFHTKLSIEGSLFKNFLAPYINYNDIRLITNKSKIENLNNNFLTFNGTGFLDFGTKFLLNIEQIASIKNINMILDLNFLKIDKLKNYTGIDDKLYPSIRFTFDKRL